jgi:hypothetical protein
MGVGELEVIVGERVIRVNFRFSETSIADPLPKSLKPNAVR